jgi:hypothetical protein
MQAIMETLFDAVYLTTVIILGFLMVRRANNRQFKLFGIMALTLGFGDAFHLVPRALALCTTGLESYTVALGIGKFITSITMTAFYVILYYVWRLRYQVEEQRGLTLGIWALALLRIALCLFPQNQWTSASAPLSWGIYRNLPFALLGALIIVLFYRSSRSANDRAFRHMGLTIILSFAFYIPVVLFADAYPLIGMLMIPKTCAYVWTVLIGYQDMQRSLKTQKA